MKSAPGEFSGQWAARDYVGRTVVTMKICAFGGRLNAGLTAFLLAGLAACGQVPGGSGPTGMSAALTKLFGSTTAFAAKGEMQVTDTAQKEVANWPMDFALLDKKIRVEIDLTQVRNQN